MSNGTQTKTLTDFLLERIAEDERRTIGYVNEDRSSSWHALGCGLNDDPGTWCECAVPARVLAECTAKRAIVEWHKSWPVLVESPPEFEVNHAIGDINSMAMRMSRRVDWLTQQEYVARFGTEPPSAPILRHLAAVYADHSDYDPSWAV